MDFFTHALAGMAVGAAWWHGLPGHDPKTRAGMPVPPAAALATGVIASILPDALDVWLYPLDLELYRRWHRVFTHTLVAWPVIAGAATAAGLALGRHRGGGPLHRGAPPIRPRMGGFTGFRRLGFWIMKFRKPVNSPISLADSKMGGPRALFAIALAAVLVHLGLDLLCDWPLRLFYPFSRFDFALGFINYSHPAFTLGFLALALYLLGRRFRRPSDPAD